MLSASDTLGVTYSRGRSHKVGPCPFAVVNNSTVNLSLLVLSNMSEGTNERYQNTINAI